MKGASSGEKFSKTSFCAGNYFRPHPWSLFSVLASRLLKLDFWHDTRKWNNPTPFNFLLSINCDISCWSTVAMEDSLWRHNQWQSIRLWIWTSNAFHLGWRYTCHATWNSNLLRVIFQIDFDQWRILTKSITRNSQLFTAIKWDECALICWYIFDYEWCGCRKWVGKSFVAYVSINWWIRAGFTR